MYAATGELFLSSFVSAMNACVCVCVCVYVVCITGVYAQKISNCSIKAVRRFLSPLRRSSELSSHSSLSLSVLLPPAAGSPCCFSLLKLKTFCERGRWFIYLLPLLLLLLRLLLLLLFLCRCCCCCYWCTYNTSKLRFWTYCRGRLGLC